MTYKEKHVYIVDTSNARPRSLWVLVRGYRITKMSKHETQNDNRTWHSLGRDLGRCVPPAAPGHTYADSVTCASVTEIASCMVAYTHTNPLACLNSSGLILLDLMPNRPQPAPGSSDLLMATPSRFPYGCSCMVGH